VCSRAAEANRGPNCQDPVNGGAKCNTGCSSSSSSWYTSVFVCCSISSTASASHVCLLCGSLQPAVFQLRSSVTLVSSLCSTSVGPVTELLLLQSYALVARDTVIIIAHVTCVIASVYMSMLASREREREREITMLVI